MTCYICAGCKHLNETLKRTTHGLLKFSRFQYLTRLQEMGYMNNETAIHLYTTEEQISGKE